MFRAETLRSALDLWGSLVGLHGRGDVFAVGPASPRTLGLLAVAAGTAFFGRNLVDWFQGWKPSPVLAYALGILFGICLLSLGHPSEFLYFQF